MWYHKIGSLGRRERHIYISCFLKIKQQQESEDKYQETVKILESGCLRGEGLGDAERKRGWLFFIINFILQLGLIALVSTLIKR